MPQLQDILVYPNIVTAFTVATMWHPEVLRGIFDLSDTANPCDFLIDTHSLNQEYKWDLQKYYK